MTSTSSVRPMRAEPAGPVATAAERSSLDLILAPLQRYLDDARVTELCINRPHALMPGSRTPVEGLYLCGSSSGNGGGINGAAGYIAANAIVDDLKLTRFWKPVAEPEWNH